MDQFLNRYHSKFSRFTDWVYHLVVINLLAIMGTILGLGIFGFFPSLMTTYFMIKSLLNKEDKKHFKTFIEVYKKYFIKANVVGWILVLMWGLLYGGWTFYVSDLDVLFHWIGMVVIIFLAMLLFLITSYLPISFVHFEKFNAYEHYRFSLLMALGAPKVTFIMALNMLFFYGFIFIQLISVFPFLAFSLPAFVNMLVARKRLLKVFTIFKDDYVTIMTLNGFARHEDIYTFYQKHYEFSHPMSFEQFHDDILYHHEIHKRLSLVVLDQKDEIIGCLLAHHQSLSVHIMMTIVDEAYQKRGYGKKMIKYTENKAYALGFDDISIGKPESIIQNLQRPFAKSLIFFKKQGYFVEDNENGYQVKKSLGEKTL